ncbi:MAG: hypothetical protein ACTH6N_04380, partial [Brachybacterium tyrofermentans]
MDSDRRRDENQDADWIFATDDPQTLPTERLPDRAEFDRYAAPLLARRRAEAVLPPSEQMTTDLSDLDGDTLRAGSEPEARTGAIPMIELDEDAADGADSSTRSPGSPGTTSGSEMPGTTSPLRAPRDQTYARSGTTPNAEDSEDSGRGVDGLVLPDRFKELGVFDALRDVLALVCMVTALTT